MNTRDYVVNLNRDTYEELCEVQATLTTQLGFVPTLGQTVRHLLAVYRGESRPGSSTAI
jgi:hypothetical protein